jgi:hypothetical protein
MQKARILAGALLAGGLWTATVFGQAPPPPPAAAGAAPAAVAAKPTFCEKLEMCIDRCRRKLCAKPLGQMLNSMTKPLTAATGGIIPGFCPVTPSAADLKKPGAAGAAAQALKDAVEAKERRAAVRLLGTFDCHWYPEAELGLAMALRTDRAECVRLEAAIALNRGCCCTKMIVEALEDCVGNGDKFGPTENSPRVQAIAMMALDRCLQCPDANIVEVDPLEEKKQEMQEEDQGEKTGPGRKVEPGQAKPNVPPPPPPMPNPIPVNPKVTNALKGSGKPSRALMEHARHTLIAAKARMANAGEVQAFLPSGQRSLAGIANYVFNGSSQSQSETTPVSATSQPPLAPAALASESNTRKSNAAARPAPRPVPISTAAPTSNSAYRPISTAAQPTSNHRVDPTVLRCLETLRDAPDPEVRHAAVQTLVTCNWRQNPESISGLIYAARSDKHAGMRVACIRSLAAMKARTPDVMNGLSQLLGDKDDWIRAESKQAIAYLQTGQASK